MTHTYRRDETYDSVTQDVWWLAEQLIQSGAVEFTIQHKSFAVTVRLREAGGR